MLRGTATEMSMTLKPVNEEKQGRDVHPMRERRFHDKQAAVLPIMIKDQVPFDENVSFKCVRNHCTPVDYCEKRLEQQLTSVSAHLQAFIVPKARCASTFFTPADVKFPRSVVCIVVTISDFSLLLQKAQVLKPASIAELKSRRSI